MEYQLTELEGVRIYEGTPEQQHIGITQTTADRIVNLSEFPADALALYTFYAYVCKWQRNNSAWATNEYIMKKFSWGKSRMMRVKKDLKKLGLIADDPRRDKKTNKITGWFVKIRYAMSTGTEIHPLAEPPGGKEETETIYVQGVTKNIQVQTFDRQYEKPSETQVELMNSKKEKIRTAPIKRGFARLRKSLEGNK